jgi:hypothetical protein
MNEGRTVFAQLLDFLPKYEFDKCVARLALIAFAFSPSPPAPNV